MAVKHKVMDYEERPTNVTLDYMGVLLRVIEKYRSEPNTLPQGNDMTSLCQLIVHTLSTLSVPTEPSSIATFTQNVQNVQDFLSLVCSMEQHEDKLVYTALNKLYCTISVPNKKLPSAAMSVILDLIKPKQLPSAVDLILEDEQEEESLELALYTLCIWTTYWSKTINLGECILIFMNGLERQKRYNMLMHVTLNVIDKIFNCIILPTYRITVAPLIMYMLSRMQSTPAAFHKIVPLVPNMIVRLKKENSMYADTYAEDIVNLCKALEEHFSGYDKLYEQLESAYALYPPSNYQVYLGCPAWSNNTNNVIVLKYEHGKVGLNNLGNTCYMNSVLQALFMTKYFSNNILTQEYRLPLMSKLQALFAMLQFSHQISLSPNDIFRAARPPGFTPGHQHDSSEFLGHLLDILHEEGKMVPNFVSGAGEPREMSYAQATNAGEYLPPTIVQQAFGGRAETIYRCHACGAESVRADNFRELQLSFPSDFSDGEAVQTLLEYYLKPERLCGDNQYHCERCSGLADAEREFRVIEPPPRLVLTIKHFHYDSISQQRTKLLHRVQYNDVIKLANATYDLYAAVIHCGTTVDSGHYYTYAKDSHKWYKFNDNWVSPTSTSDLYNLPQSETPYILFYSRHDCAKVEPITRGQLPAPVELLLRREMVALEEEEEDEEERQAQRAAANKERFARKDDPPPPGCGGGGGLQFTTTGFVC